MKLTYKLPALLLTVCLLASVAGGTALAADTAKTAETAAEEDLYTERDLAQEADLENAEAVTVSSGENVTITKEGVYVLRGSAENATVIVAADDTAKVQLVLDGLSITNSDFPCIYVKQADKTFITLSGSSSLTVTGAFRADGSTNTDGVIFSKDDLTLNGTGSLRISSSDNGIVCKDDLKITGGTFEITTAAKGVEAKDSIRICGGDLTVTPGTNGIQCSNDDEQDLGWIVISGGKIRIKAGNDGVKASSLLRIDGGTLELTAAEGLEATCVMLNGGEITISATDDGINASQKSSAYSSPAVIINGGTLTISMGSGDTDGVDSNGSITMNGGYVSITANSAMDYETTGTFNGGTLIVNGTQINYIPNQMMGGGMGGRGGFGGGGGGRR